MNSNLEAAEEINLTDILQKRLNQLQLELPDQYRQAIPFFEQDKCQLLATAKGCFDLWVPKEGLEFSLVIINEEVFLDSDDKDKKWTAHYIAGLMHLKDVLQKVEPKLFEHKQYSREGMIARVLQEREQKANRETYRFQWADNVFGDHYVFSASGNRYKVFLRDFQQEKGYSDSPDSRINKLGTSKHIMAAFQHLKENPSLFNKLDKTYPFVEVFLDPLNDNQITWFYPHELAKETAELLNRFFGPSTYISRGEESQFVEFADQATSFENIVIRPEVTELLEKVCRAESLQWVKDHYEVPYDQVKATLFPYQRKGVEFIAYREGSILADEMGLGKTLQAIAAAVAKKKIFGFQKTLIVCPASLKDQWKREIEKFTDEKALNVTGPPDVRAESYLIEGVYFFIVNYETVLRDCKAINKARFDFLILDEAQRIKNFETKTASAIKRIEKNHTLVLTGTPIENRLTDLFSIMQVIDDEFLGPLWEFSYQHCLFDHHMPNKINGYYDLQKLKKRLKPVLLRREKREVLKELPNVNTQDIIVPMSREQREYHASYASGVQKIARKKFKTPMDFTRLQQLLAAMRMVCNSTYLIDGYEEHHSPKLVELEHILLEKLDILNSDRKVIIFSEWHKSHKLIGDMLEKHNLKYVAFSGKIPVHQRGKYIKKFEEDSECKFFLSTESGGAGLNLQFADILINFELPWNPAKKNQRIGRIDRLGQQSKHLTVINFITTGSIEMRIASGIMLKENLFEGVLNKSNTIEMVDFSEKGRAQFLEELAKMADEFVLDSEQAQEEEEQILLEAHTEVEEVEEPEAELEAEIADALAPAEPPAALPESTEPEEPAAPTEQLEEVLQQGMGFFSGLYKMATGADMNAEDQQISVDKTTGEVTMKFKLPGFGK